MAKRKLTREFREFLECLNRAGVEYLLVGGYAVNYYGYHRFTEDIDFWIADSEENFLRLLAAVRDFFGDDLAGLDLVFLKNNESLFWAVFPIRSKCSRRRRVWSSGRFTLAAWKEFLMAYR